MTSDLQTTLARHQSPSSCPLFNEPQWRDPRHFQYRQPLPTTIKQWLLDPGSLTEKLVARANGQFYVEVLSQTIQRAQVGEYRALHLDFHQWTVIREVILYGNQTPWVFARTVIPLSTLKGPLRRLHNLGNKPLGRELFTDPTMRREPVTVATLTTSMLPTCVRTTQNQTEPTWGRRSLFYLRHKPLLVAEVFLTSFFE